ncbi:carboxylate-amine ligase [Streptomyces corynorhini]|uniref:Putative glutamate--cysteine ligase 2 n=1 Tax=Streptomyces corynorhini TaxID=2282652 RepID=A0A370B7C4_9ACTN|nr:glutamate--cysteine ligase [Streptomyces corynorhini]RDG35636.1 YbdK family carboxylate-amine ligase [Streptomyces corynorhini]
MSTNAFTSDPQDEGPERPTVRGALSLGVEEEYFVVDAQTHRLTDSGPLLDRVCRDGSEDYTAELRRCMIESRTGICWSLTELRADLRARRETLISAAAGAGTTIVASGSYPPADWRREGFTSRPRFDHIAGAYARLADEHLVCACHVHVGVEGRDRAVEVVNRVRPWLPALLALSASSPFWTGTDTGYASYRSTLWARWPIAGMPPTLSSYAEHCDRVRRLVTSGTSADTGQVFWDVRPGTRFHTVEFRIADSCTTVDEAVLQAGLSRALVQRCLTEIAQGDPAPEVPLELLNAAKWRAARFGLTGQLVDPVAAELVPAAELVNRFLDHVRAPLTEAGDWAEIARLAHEVLSRGNGADRQLRAFGHSGTVAAVVKQLIAESTTTDHRR